AHEVRVKGGSLPLRVLVGIQSERDYLKGAAVIGTWLDEIAAEHPDKLQVVRAEDVPYDRYCQLLDEADVMVDQLYSYTPAMNALAAMARGTVVIGGGEEAFYRFIGERELRPIINVRPDRPEESLATLREALLTPGRVEALSRQSRQFVERHHDARQVARAYAEMYEGIRQEQP
ncbi:MAG: glycosyltransferase, partial [Bacteroidaceae bacterium]|nr:glycosyltransferase [Bacteroidaceae bacterium]